MSAFIIKIEQPIQIPAVIYEARSRAAKGRIRVFLEHQEGPNVVRGRRQPLEKSHIEEVKRPDTGRSWYHPGTFCYMSGSPCSNSENQEQWAASISELLHKKRYDPAHLAYDDGDLFFCNGSKKHMMGTSSFTDDVDSTRVRVLRACWYEKSPIPEISDLLKADGIDPAMFRERQQLVRDGFFGYLTTLFHAKEVSPQEFISKSSMLEARALQKEKGGTVYGSCVMGKEK